MPCLGTDLNTTLQLHILPIIHERSNIVNSRAKHNHTQNIYMHGRELETNEIYMGQHARATDPMRTKS